MSIDVQLWQKHFLHGDVILRWVVCLHFAFTLNNASDFQANGLLSDYIGWTNGLSDYRTNGLGLGLGVQYSPLVQWIINCDPLYSHAFSLLLIISVWYGWEIGFTGNVCIYNLYAAHSYSSNHTKCIYLKHFLVCGSIQRARQHICYGTLYAIAHQFVCPSIRLSHGWISQKRLKLGSCNFHHRVAP